MKKLIFKIALLLLSFVIVAFPLSELLVPKWVDGNNPQTLQNDAFEKLEANSLDVLVLGSCQSYQGFNPAVFWEDFGLTSYVMASPDQRLYVSYQYLSYALKTQKPKVVLLDTLMLTLPNTKSEVFDTKAIYSIRNTAFRQSASDEIFEIHYDGDRKLPQYYVDKGINSFKSVFPVFSFNSTFDFSSVHASYYLGKLDDPTYNGGVPMFVRMDMTEMSNYMEDNCLNDCSLDAVAVEYFEKIVDLCQQNHMELILFKTMSPTYWSLEKSELISAYADSLDLEFIDFNVAPEKFGLALSEHLYAPWKLNADGMKLTTQYLGNHLQEKHSHLFEKEKTDATVTYYDNMAARYNKAYETAVWEIIPYEES